jgi:16S rRNA processing protein RimM
VTLARFVKTQGRRGEVAAEVHSDVPDRFAPGMKVYALTATRCALEIEDLWPHKGLLIFKFAGVDSISDAERIVGAELQVPRTERAQLEPGWTYVSDLVGCALFDHSREVGRVEDVQFGAGEAPLLIIGSGDKTFEIPFAEAYLDRVDLPRRQVRMNLPQGMLEINGPMTAEEKREQSRDLKGRGFKPRRQRRRRNRGL